MKFYNLSSEESLNELKSNQEGLSEEEAKKRLIELGPNKLKEAKKESKLVKFLSQFKNLMIVVLLIAAIVSFIISYINKESYLDSIIILLIVFINAILGYLEEIKADQAIESLKKMQTTKVKVKRNGIVEYINSEDLVIGDIVLLEAGDKVAADARLLMTNTLKVDESSLTGESDSVLKDTKKIEKEVALNDRTNMVYAGTNVVYGKGECVVTKTGMSTEIGLIASSLDNTKTELTPLQKKINGISKVLTIIISIVILAMFIVSIIKNMEFTEALLLAISLAVAAIPEGLPAVITVILSLGMSALAKKKAIVRKMSSVETLGSTEIICTDKTGTITQNKMELKEIYFDHKTINSDTPIEGMFLYNMALNNDVEQNDEGLVGDPTEIAIINYLKNTIDPFKLKEEHPRVNEIPFDSERKMMSVVCEIKGKKYLLTKGSFDSVINCCTKIDLEGKVKKLSEKNKLELREVEKEKSNRALRLLAFAYKEIKDNKIEENDLIFEGLTGVIDPPRVDVKESIKLCKKAHIIPIMITGDSLNTAIAIAKDIGILTKEDEAISGMELDKLSEEELYQNIEKYKVYARVSPMNKLSIVNAWKKKGRVVAMTGDGVNDAPAIKASDIGIGMGITGTEVSKSVADIILVDDSFSTIVTAVKEGRRIFDNIRNVITYLLIGNITEVITVFIGLIFGYTIFVPIQLLFINLITDSIPAIALAFESADSDIMNRRVRKKDSSFFTPFLISKILVSSCLKSIAILFVYFLNLHISGPEVAATTSFLCLMILELCFAFSCKNIKKPVIGKNIFNNSKLNICILGILILGILIFVTPLRTIFDLTTISLMELIYCIMIILVMVLIDEILKVVLAKKFKD